MKGKILIIMILITIALNGGSLASINLSDGDVKHMIHQAINAYLSMEGEGIVGQDEYAIQDILSRKKVVFRYKHEDDDGLSVWKQGITDVDIPLMMPIVDSDIHLERVSKDYVNISYSLRLDYGGKSDLVRKFTWFPSLKEAISMKVKMGESTLSAPISFTRKSGNVWYFEGVKSFHLASDQISVKILTEIGDDYKLLAFENGNFKQAPTTSIIGDVHVLDDEGFLVSDIPINKAYLYEPCIFTYENLTHDYSGEGQTITEALYSFLLSIRDTSSTYQQVNYSFPALGVNGSLLMGELSVDPIIFRLAMPDIVYRGIPFDMGLISDEVMNFYFGSRWHSLSSGVNRIEQDEEASIAEYLLVARNQVVRKGFAKVIDYQNFSPVYVKGFLKAGDKVKVSTVDLHDGNVRNINVNLMVNGKYESLDSYRCQEGDKILLQSTIAINYQSRNYKIKCQPIHVGILPKLAERAYLLQNDVVYYRHTDYKCVQAHTANVDVKWSYSRFNDMDFLPVDQPLTGDVLRFDACGTYQWEAVSDGKVIKRRLFTVINQPPFVSLSLDHPSSNQYVVGVVLDPSLTEEEAKSLEKDLVDFQHLLMGEGLPLVIDVRNLKGEYMEDDIVFLSKASLTSPPEIWSYDEKGFKGSLTRRNIHYSDRYVDRGGFKDIREQKYFYRQHQNTKESHGTYDPWTSIVDKESPAPATYQINSDGFVGSLPRVGTIEHYHIREDLEDGEWKSVGSWTAQYEGTLFKVTTTWVSDYQLERKYIGEYEGKISQTMKDDLVDFDIGSHLRTFAVIGSEKLDEVYVDESINYDHALEGIKEKVRALISELSLGESNIYLLGEEVSLDLTTSDKDGDDVVLKNYDMTYALCYENPVNIPMLLQWQTKDYQASLTNVGEYTISALIEDGADLWEFRKESRSQPVTIKVHRKPIAKARLEVVMDEDKGNLIIHDESYDLDRRSGKNRGIFKVDVVIVDEKTGQVFRGDAHKIPIGKYLLKYRVYDEYFAVSDWFITNFEVTDKGIGMLSARVDTNPWSVGETYSFSDLVLQYERPLDILIERMNHGRWQEVTMVHASNHRKIREGIYGYPNIFTWDVIDNGSIPLRLKAIDGKREMVYQTSVESLTSLSMSKNFESLVKDEDNLLIFKVDPLVPDFTLCADGRELVGSLMGQEYHVNYAPSHDLVNLVLEARVPNASSLNRSWSMDIPCYTFSLIDLNLYGTWSHARNRQDYYEGLVRENDFFGGDTIHVEGDYTGSATSGQISVDGEDSPLLLSEGKIRGEFTLHLTNHEKFSEKRRVTLSFYQEDKLLLEEEVIIYTGPSILNFLYFQQSN